MKEQFLAPQAEKEEAFLQDEFLRLFPFDFGILSTKRVKDYSIETCYKEKNVLIQRKFKAFDQRDTYAASLY